MKLAYKKKKVKGVDDESCSKTPPCSSQVTLPFYCPLLLLQIICTHAAKHQFGPHVLR